MDPICYSTDPRNACVSGCACAALMYPVVFNVYPSLYSMDVRRPRVSTVCARCWMDFTRFNILNFGRNSRELFLEFGRYIETFARLVFYMTHRGFLVCRRTMALMTPALVRPTLWRATNSSNVLITHRMAEFPGNFFSKSSLYSI